MKGALACSMATALLLSACATPMPKPDRPDKPPTQCGMRKLGAYLNRQADEPTLASVRSAVRHDRIRVLRPGTAMTMDYRADRLNIDVGEDGRIRRFYCG